jgi:hypothetical protein
MQQQKQQQQQQQELPLAKDQAALQTAASG